MVTLLPERIREVREELGISQSRAAEALGISQPSYSRVEDGSRTLKGDELVRLADLFGVRAAAITGVLAVRERARYAARTDGSQVEMTAMRAKLYAYLELYDYLTQQGISAP
ncbi:MAG: helix-turn-helix domain-containing protein [Actinomycetes bacterium]